MAQPRDYSEGSEEVRELLTELESRGRELLETHREALDALAAALEAHETLEIEEIRELLAGHAPTPASSPP